jgi:hypothetical protein
MITKISANGSSDINMLLVSPPAPAAWANAGVISISDNPQETGMNRQRISHHAGSGKFARTITAAVPIATLPDP